MCEQIDCKLSDSFNDSFRHPAIAFFAASVLPPVFWNFPICLTCCKLQAGQLITARAGIGRAWSVHVTLYLLPLQCYVFHGLHQHSQACTVSAACFYNAAASAALRSTHLDRVVSCHRPFAVRLYLVTSKFQAKLQCAHKI